MNTEWKPVTALRDSLLWTASSLAAIGKEQDVITLEGRKRTVGEILDEANEALNVPDDAAPTSHPIPTGATGEDEQRLSLGVVLGLGEYIIKHTAIGEPAQVVFSEATKEERETRTVGDLKDCEPGPFDHSRIRGRIQFASASGLDALEVQLRQLREVHWPETIAAAPAAGDALDDTDRFRAAYMEWQKKTDFIQDRLASGELPVKYLGWHRADVMRDLIDLASANSPVVDALDARRYRAIRNPPYSNRYGDLYAMTFQGDGDIPLKGDALDAAADAALAAIAQQKGEA